MKRHLREWHDRVLKEQVRDARDKEFLFGTKRMADFLDMMLGATKDGSTLEISTQQSGEQFVVMIARRKGNERRCRMEHGIESRLDKGRIGPIQMALMRCIADLHSEATRESFYRRRTP